MKIVLLSALSSVLFIALFTSCRQKPCQDPSNFDCENYDPCFKKVSADFKMEIRTEGLGAQYFEVDTIMRYNAVYFKALDSTDVTYEWKIGNDPTVFTDRIVRLGFDFSTQLNVTLTVKRKSGCALADGGEKTLTKKLVVMEKSAINGSYTGYLETNPSDKFTVRIAEPRPDTLFGSLNYYIDNLFNGCKRDGSNRYDASFLISYKYFDMENRVDAGLFPCVPLSGVGKLDNTHSQLTIEFDSYDKQTKKIVRNKFMGTKSK